jgi:prepilin-type N-terminal cleavage/methylation domain-containing protein
VIFTLKEQTDRKRGLTLSEIIVALGVMAVVSLTVIGLFSKLLISTQKSSQVVTADLLCKAILEEAVREGPPNWGVGGDFSVNGGKATLYTSEEKKTGYNYQVQPNRVHTDDKMGELWEVTVNVSWWGDRVDTTRTRQGMGRLSRELTRIVYIRGRTP